MDNDTNWFWQTLKLIDMWNFNEKLSTVKNIFHIHNSVIFSDHSLDYILTAEMR